MHRIILRLLYNGRGFHGFQRQPIVRTIEGEVERSLSRHGCVKNFRNAYYAAGSRTDKEVHALAQTISFYTSCNIEKIASVLEELEPEIHVWAYRLDNTGEFHPRYWALWREYVYISNKNQVKPVEPRNSMNYTMKQLIGCKDYFFLGLPKNAQTFHCVFDIRVTEWRKKIVYHIIGSSFARQMVRKIIGLLESRGKPSKIEHIRPVEPRNLLLFNIRYSFSFKIINLRKLVDIIRHHSRREVVFEYLYQNYVSRNAYWYDEFV